jgi:hypothetical protein
MDAAGRRVSDLLWIRDHDVFPMRLKLLGGIAVFVAVVATTVRWMHRHDVATVGTGAGDPRPVPSGLDDAASEPETAVAPLRQAAELPDAAPAATALVPWDPQVLAAQPKDMWGTPLAPKSFLHKMLNNNSLGQMRSGAMPTPYRIRLDTMIEQLPAGFREKAMQQQAELAKVLAAEVELVRELDIAHWERRYLDYHRAVEAGHVIVVDNNDAKDTHECAARNGEALKAANLGVMNRDFFYITSSGRSLDGKLGKYSNLIYLRRSDYPESFAIFDAIQEAHARAEALVRQHLGAPR